jgi:hypothetical protein
MTTNDWNTSPLTWVNPKKPIDSPEETITISFEVTGEPMETPALIPNHLKTKPMDVKFPSMLPEPLKKPTAYWEFK